MVTTGTVVCAGTKAKAGCSRADLTWVLADFTTGALHQCAGSEAHGYKGANVVGGNFREQFCTRCMVKGLKWQLAETLDGKYVKHNCLGPQKSQAQMMVEDAIKKAQEQQSRVDPPKPPKPPKPAPQPLKEQKSNSETSVPVKPVTETIVMNGLTEAQVRAIAIEEAEKRLKPVTITVEIKAQGLPEIDTTGQHRLFPLLVILALNRIPTYLVGPPGSGKSIIAREVAKSLNLAYGELSCGPVPQGHILTGYMDANGRYVPGKLRELVETGGVFLLDEIDAAHPGTIIEMNNLLALDAGDTYHFPDGSKVPISKDLIFFAGANTTGMGPTSQWVNRQPLDAASRDRFFMLEMGYDDALLARMAGLSMQSAPYQPAHSGYDPAGWFGRVRSLIQAVHDKKKLHVISPRAIKYGVKLLEYVDRVTLEDGLLWKGLDPTAIKELCDYAAQGRK